MIKTAVAVEGWNAEAAFTFARAARKFRAAVTLTRADDTVDGKDDIEVMTLAPNPGEEVAIVVDGSDEKAAFDVLLAELLAVIEPSKDRLSALTKHESKSSMKTARPRRRREADVAALDGVEVEALRSHRLKPVTGSYRLTGHRHDRESEHYCVRRDAHPPADKPTGRRGKKLKHNAGKRKSVRKPTPRRKPRKRKR